MRIYRTSCIMIVVACIALLPFRAYSKTYAWLTDGKNKAYKLDVASNIIVQKIEVDKGVSGSSIVQDTKNAIAEDPGKSLLIIIYDYPGRFMGQGVKVFNLKTFSFSKDLGITSKDPHDELPKIIVPPVGDKFYVIWWDKTKEVNGEGGEKYSIYDKTTLSKISDLSSFPIDLNQPRMISADGSKLYGINTDKNEIKVYESVTLNLLETISITNLWSTPLYMKNVVSETDTLRRGDKVLFEENIKNSKGDPNNVKYFAYDISSRTISNKVAIKEVSNEYMSPDGSKIIANEISYTYRGSSIASVNHLNKIHIYDVATGQKIKYIDLSGKYAGLTFSGITPDSSKLYLAAKNISTSDSTTIVIDLKTFDIVAEIPVKASLSVFFEDQ